MQSLLSPSYTNDFVSTFPGDTSGVIQPRQTPGMLYSRALPTPVRNPQLIAWSDDLAAELGIAAPAGGEEIAILGGSAVAPAMKPYAACYGGHQFGHWAGQLGDGRAITLGEWTTPDGAPMELQLKGAGPTPYSRRADGRAVLRSSVREYLMSEAMHHLGVPTTRALSLVSTGEAVMRDMFYDGNPQAEPGAVVMRVAPGFLRFGSFELPAVRRETDNLRHLAEWTIARFYPQFRKEDDRIVLWYREIVRRTAFMVSEWMRVGFVHGVMNTDNMSILGLTIDYGPFSFLDDYDRNFTPNTTDLPGRRYAFSRQPAVAKWNLACLAGALAPLLPETAPLAEALQAFDDDYGSMYYAMMGRKMGLDAIGAEDVALIDRMEETLALVKPDMTLFFRRLTDLHGAPDEAPAVAHFSNTFYGAPDAGAAAALEDTISAYRSRIRRSGLSPEESVGIMRAANPAFILRNYLLHEAIQALDRGDRKPFDRLHEAIRRPYDPRTDELTALRPEWATAQPGCSMLSCSS